MTEDEAKDAKSDLLPDLLALGLAVAPWAFPGPALAWRLLAIASVAGLWLLGRFLYKGSIAPVFAVAVLSILVRVICWKVMAAIRASGGG
jgi:hypothetical protein